MWLLSTVPLNKPGGTTKEEGHEVKLMVGAFRGKLSDVGEL